MINVEYRLVSKHAIKNNDGEVRATPALPQTSRLYVVVNGSAPRPVYVGTAANVQERFKPRMDAYRVGGFQAVCLDPITIMVFQMFVNDKSAPPHNDGISAGIDVEHIFVRTYVAVVGVGVRNVGKKVEYKNTTGELLRLSWTDPGGLGWVGPGATGHFDLDAGKTL